MQPRVTPGVVRLLFSLRPHCGPKRACRCGSVSFAAAVFFLMSLHSVPAQPPPPAGQVPAWVQDAVFYQIFPERFANGDPANDPAGTEPWGGTPTPGNYFGGDLRGIIGHLDYIAALGVNALYLNPIFTSPTNHKYQTTDYRSIDPHFGDDAVFRELLDSCHARGIRVILDGVFNHTGVGFFAFDDVKRNGRASRYTAWYTFRGFPVGPVSRPNYECWWGYGSLPKLNIANPEVRDYLFDVTRRWMGFGIDGWRLDVPNEIPHDFWIAWRRLVKELNPDAYITGEIWQDASEWLKGDQFDGVMNYRFRDAALDFFARDTIGPARFDAVLERQRTEYPVEVNFALQNLLGSHDTERFLTACRGDTSAVKLAWLFQMTYPGAPMVYYGDEIGMEGGKDPDCRKTMVWDPVQQDSRLLATMQELIALRRGHDVLRRGSYERLIAEDATRVLAFARRLPGSTAVVMLNRSASTREMHVPCGLPASQMRQAWPGGPVPWTASGQILTATLGPMSGAVFIQGE
jgi:cyclomaltodextrinase / maltogenic alpha-amylase / neopullulanase